jgi:hypothetical protein
MLKNDNEGNFKINFFAENRKEWKFYIEKVLVGSFFEFFADFTITFLKGSVFWPKKHSKTKIDSIN